MFIKKGENLTLTASSIQSPTSIMADSELAARFEKFAFELKAIAPKAEDFLYFTAIMMHAAESSLLDESGELKKLANSDESVTSHWEKAGESWKWVCSDPNIQPFKNANADIFPEEELIKAHKAWIGRPLCLDHKSDSVDHIRGVIIDTYYDLPKKRVIALCALDKKNYPDLARKVSSKYATSVSMGTAVGKAICSDCGRVARAEAEFCDHMRNKTCYGEINIDLKPIELSIVVNGADPGAQIKYVMAAANSIARYINQKEDLISKMSTESLDPAVIAEIRDDAKKLLAKLDLLEKTAEKAEKEVEESEESEEEEDDKKKSSSKQTIKIAKVLNDLKAKVDELQSTMDKLQKNSEEHNMSNKTAYFQGGGGVNEPTPGKPKYEKENYQSIRDGEDKQMNGQSPFPDVGPIDGMHPGYKSFGESEEARKKRLQRMAEEQEARSIRRQAIVNNVQKALEDKTAYFQGGGDVNEPTPGKPKYEKENYQSIRDNEDKQMNGQSPFPDVGAVDGLHPSPASCEQKDELKRKQMLSRASTLKGKFYKAANPDGTDNLGESSWNIFSNDKLVLTATVNEITGGKADTLYESIASEKFGGKILNMFRTESFEKVSALLKGAQAEMMPEVDPMAAPSAMEENELMPEDAGGTGDPKDELPELLTQAENTLADIRSAVEALMEEPGSELSEYEELAEGMPREAQLLELQKKVGGTVLTGMKKAKKTLAGQIEELRMAKRIQDNRNKIDKEQYKYACELTEELVGATKVTLADCLGLMKAFVKYAHGTEAIMKKKSQEMIPMTSEQQHAEWAAQEAEAEARAKAEKMQPEQPEQVGAGIAGMEDMRGPNMPGVFRAQLPEESDEDYENEERSFLLNARPGRVDTLEPILESVTKGLPEAVPDYLPEMLADDAEDENASSEIDLGPAKLVMNSRFDKNTKKGRAALRNSLSKAAQKGLKFQKEIEIAHPGGGTTIDLDVKPSGDLGKVERIDEQHAKMMEVATAPPRIRSAAADIQELVAEGALIPTDEMFKELIAEGLDPDAVKYWKAYYGEAKDGGKEFASELVKKYAARKNAEHLEAVQVKVARCYDLANSMVRRGMLANNPDAIKAQANELLKYDDEGFVNFNNFVQRQSVKKSSSMPQVGQLMSTAGVILPAPEAKQEDLKGALEDLFSQSGLKPRLF